MTGVLLLALLTAPAVDWDLAPTLSKSVATSSIISTSTQCPTGTCPSGYCTRPNYMTVVRPRYTVAPTEPAPPPPSGVFGPTVQNDSSLPIPGTSSEAEVQVMADVVPCSNACEQPATMVVQGDACQAAVIQGDYVAECAAVMVQAGPVRRFFARQPIRTFWRGVASRIVARVQARCAARQARWAVRRGSGQIVTVWVDEGGDACTSARW